MAWISIQYQKYIFLPLYPEPGQSVESQLAVTVTCSTAPGAGPGHLVTAHGMMRTWPGHSPTLECSLESPER